MFGWFRPKCPIDEMTREWLDFRWSWLEREFGAACLRKRRVILPMSEFFPDAYHRTEEDARTILDRVCSYMDLSSDTIILSFYSNDRNPLFTDQFRSGAAGLFSTKGNKFRIEIDLENLSDPLAMIATMAHELGHVHLLGHGRITEAAEDHEPLTDLLTVFFGLGVITSNSVVRERTTPTDRGTSWRIQCQGYLRMQEYGYALAKFARARHEDGLPWSRQLRLDVRSAFKQSMRVLRQELQD